MVKARVKLVLPVVAIEYAEGVPHMKLCDSRDRTFDTAERIRSDEA